MTPSDHPNKKSIYITADTEARLKALGGTTRAENVRRALDFAECAEGLAETLHAAISYIKESPCDPDITAAQRKAWAKLEKVMEVNALAKYQETKK